ncbi:MAG: hypothetical protein CMJ18_13295 [Phycisphaeraceae bacterium]|nr:hypothetical protein [Phycisphaeraceae bacterium]
MKKHLSPKDLARAIGVSESSLKRWADGGMIKGYRTAGGHRRIDLTEAIRFIRESEMPVREPRLLGLSEVEGPLDAAQIPEDPTELLYQALEQGESKKVRTILTSMYLDGRGVADICDGPIRAAMSRLGELWRHQSDGVLIEHRATDVCISALNLIRSMLPEPAESAPLALGGAPPDDPYLLPSLMAATVMAAEGWRGFNLGPDCPTEVLIAAAKQTGARLVWISISAGQDEAELTRLLSRLADHLIVEGVDVVLGGRSLPHDVSLRRHNIHAIPSMSALAALSRELVPAAVDRDG